MVSGSTDCRDRKSAERWLLQFRSKLALENINLKETKIPTFGDCYDLWTKGRAPRLGALLLERDPLVLLQFPVVPGGCPLLPGGCPDMLPVKSLPIWSRKDFSRISVRIFSLIRFSLLRN